MDRIAVEFLKKGGDSVVDWLVKLFDLYMAQSEVLKDSQCVYIVPFYKNKQDKNEYSNYTGISLFIIPSKEYGRSD